MVDFITHKELVELLDYDAPTGVFCWKLRIWSEGMITKHHIPRESIMAIIREPVDDTVSIEEHIAIRIAAALNAWPNMEHLSATSINIGGSDVAISERINLPVVTA